MRYQCKARICDDFILVNNSNLGYILSHTITKISWITSHIFCVDRGEGFIFSAPVRCKPLKWGLRNLVSLKKLETSFCGTVQSIFRYLEPFRRDSRLCLAYRRTDMLIANAALNYVAQPKKTRKVTFTTTNSVLKRDWRWDIFAWWQRVPLICNTLSKKNIRQVSRLQCEL